VFGAGGFVGTSVLESLLDAKGTEIIASDITPTLRREDERVIYRRVDILDSRQVDEVVGGCDIVVNLAAGGVNASLADPRSDMKINIEGTLNILEAARKTGVKRVVYSSASSVIGSAKYVPTDEEHPCLPVTPYAAAKLCCENYFRVYGNLYGLRYVIFRFFNVYGPFEKTGLAPVTTFMSNMLSNTPIKVTGDGTQTRDFVFVKDVAHFIRLAATVNVDHALLNLGTGIHTSIMTLIRLCADTVGRTPKIEFLPSRPGDVSNFYADTRKLQTIFGELPRTALEEGLRQTFEWLGSRPPAKNEASGQ
jgi:UDP-glucose 4-epimerase